MGEKRMVVQRDQLRHRIAELEQQLTNLTSTVEAWNHAEIMDAIRKVLEGER